MAITTATATSSTIELRPLGESTPATVESDNTPGTPRSEEDGLDIDGRQEFSLPPVDGGKDAWFFLAACFFVEALTWGMLFSRYRFWYFGINVL